MNAIDIATWVEVVASIAVLVSLVFLNVQIKQTNSLMRSEARQAQVVIDQEHIAKFIEHPDLASAYASKESLDHDDKTRLWFWVVLSMRAREHEWFQYQHGALDAQSWDSYKRVIPFTLGTNRTRRYWSVTRRFFDPGFAELVDEMIRDQPETDFWDAYTALD
jgi:hypothetical protein